MVGIHKCNGLCIFCLICFMSTLMYFHKLFSLCRFGATVLDEAASSICIAECKIGSLE
jgi:hypothetical protein